MIGCRPLTDKEIATISSHLSLRDKTFFMLGIKTGFRVSELLSLRVQDVFQHNQCVDRVTVARKNMKGNKSGRTVALHASVKSLITELVRTLPSDSHLFVSRTNKPISRIQAYRLLKDAVALARCSGKVATHSLRKTFANVIYERLDKDLVKTQKALGHKSINSTVSYLSFAESEIEDAILE